MACLTEPDEKIRLATLYQAKILRKNLDSELKARDAHYHNYKFLSSWPKRLMPFSFLMVGNNSSPCDVETGRLKAFLISFNGSQSFDGRFDEDSSSCMFYSFETYWLFYRFHAWICKFKCSRRY